MIERGWAERTASQGKSVTRRDVAMWGHCKQFGAVYDGETIMQESWRLYSKTFSDPHLLGALFIFTRI
jgi:hypothetical protein